MKRLPFRPFLFSIFAFAAIAFFWPSGQVDLSSKALRCETYFQPKKKFNYDAFVNFLQQLRSPLTEDILRECISQPEKFLAVVEFASREQAYDGFRFDLLVKDLTDKELINLHKLLRKALNPGELTEFELKNLVTKIYRIAHRPKGFWRTAWQTKSLRETFDRLDDQKIYERVEMALFEDGMTKTFASVIKEPGLRIRFREVLNKNKFWIDTSFAISLWVASAYSTAGLGEQFGPVVDVVSKIPPYVPSLSRFVEVEISDDIKNLTREKGLNAGIEALKPEMKTATKKSRFLGLARNTYMLVYAAIFAATVMPALDARTEAEVGMQEMTSPFDRYTETAKMTAEERGRADFERFLKFAKANGIVLDRNSPEMQKELQDRIAAYKSEPPK